MNGTTWQDFVDSIREAGSYRDRVKPKRLEKDINTYTGHGSKKAQKGSPFKKLKVSFNSS